MTPFVSGTILLILLTHARMVSIMLAPDSVVMVITLSCTLLTLTMWVVVITVLLVVAGVRERVIGIMMVRLVVLKTRPSFMTEQWMGCLFAGSMMVDIHLSSLYFFVVWNASFDVMYDRTYE